MQDVAAVKPWGCEMVPALRLITRLTGGLIILLSTGFVVFAAMASQPAGPPPVADGIVALTGGEARIDEAVRLLADHRAKRMLISGVNPHTTRSALERLTPDYAALFDCCIDIGYWAQDTIGNADETQVWANRRGFRRLIVVTSGYHMARSMAELSRAMPDIELIPHPVLASVQRAEAWWTSPTATRLLFVEYLKFLPALARLGAARAFGSAAPASSATAVAPADFGSKASVD